MAAHTHDGIDWVTRLADLRTADASNAPALRAVADRLIESLPAPQPTVFDVGSGAGGMSAALAEALAGRAARTLTPLTTETFPRPLTAHPAAGGGEHAAAGEDASAGARAAGDLVGDGGTAPTGEWAGGGSGQSAGDVGRAGTLVLIDAVPELLAAASEAARAAVGVAGMVDVRTARIDLATMTGHADGSACEPGPVGAGLPAADLVWAANVAHHLPDQRRAVTALVDWLAPGGCLALCEGGLSMRCLPWDLGIGEPGLQDRLAAAHGTWFHRMRTEMPGAVRLTVGWNQVLVEAGLGGVTAFSYLVDVPAPLSDGGRAAVVSWVAWMARATGELLDPADVDTLHRLLDEDDPAYVGRRDDVFLLKASTVYLGWRR